MVNIISTTIHNYISKKKVQYNDKKLKNFNNQIMKIDFIYPGQGLQAKGMDLI